MANNIKLTAEEIIELRKLITELNGAIDDVSFNNLINSGPAAKKVLTDLRKEYKEWTSDISDSRSQFQKLADQMKNTKSGVSEVSKVYKGLNSIAKDIQYHQKGITELNEKGAKNLQKELQKQRQELVNASSLLTHEREQLEIKKSLAESDQLALDNEIKRLELKGRSGTLTKDEKKLLKEHRKEYQSLSTDISEINDELKEKENLQNEINGIIKEEDANYKQIVNTLNVITTQQKNLRKATGLTGAAIDGIGKAFNKLGMGGLSSAMGLDEAKEKIKDVANKVTEGGDKAAGLVDKFKILGAGLSVIGKNIFSYLTDPLTIVTGLVAGVVASVKGLISLFEESAKFTGDISKSFGLSADEASRIGDNLRSAAGSDFFMTTEESRKAFDMMANATGVINESFSNSKAVTAMNDLVTYAGYSTEEAEKLYSLSQLNNQSVDDTVSSLQGQLKVLQVNNKLRINEKQAVEMVAKASATVRMNLGANPKKLADAAFYATKLGMTLDEISSAAEQTLNFESAIQNQLEYQVLTGKEINIDAYQQAAASGDAAAASKELNKLIEEQGPNIEKNTFAQEALSKTLGISREQLMKSIQLQKLQKKLGGEQVDIEKAINLKMKEGLSYEEAAAEVGKDGYKSILEQNKNAQAFSRTVSEIKESFMNALSGSEGFKKLFSKENIAKYVAFIEEKLIPIVIDLAEQAGKFIEFLTKDENIQVLKDGFDGLVNTVKSLKEPIKWVIANLGTIAKVLGAIMLLNFAGKFIGNIASMGKAVGGLITGLGKVGSMMAGLGKSTIPSATPPPTSSTSPTPGGTPSSGGGSNMGSSSVNEAKNSKNIISKLFDGIKDIVNSIKDVLKSAVNLIKEVAKDILKTISELIKGIGNVFNSVVDVVKNVGKNILSTLSELIKGIGNVLNTGAEVIGKVGNTLATGAMNIFNTLVDGLTKASNSLPTILGNLGKAVGSFFSGLSTGLVTFAQAMAAPTVLFGLPVGLIVVGMAMGLAKAAQIAAPAIAALGPMFEGLSTVVAALAPVVEAAGSAISKVVGAIGDAAVNIIKAVADSISQMEKLDPTKLVLVGLSLGQLAVGLLALTAAEVVNGIASFFGASPVDTLKQLEAIDSTKMSATAVSLKEIAASLQSFGGLNTDPIVNAADALDKFNNQVLKGGLATALNDFLGADPLAIFTQLSTINTSNLDTVSTSVTNVGTSMSNFQNSLDSEKINNISNSIESLGEKLVSFYENDFSDTEVAAQLQELTNIDSSKIVTLAEAIAKLSESFIGLSGTLSSMGDIAPVVTVTEEFIKLHKTVTATPLEQAVEAVKTGVKNTYEQAKSWVTSLVSDAAISQKLNTPQISDGIIQMRDGVVQVQDGNLNPNGGLVVSKYQKGQLQPVAQGIKEDNVYLTPNKPAQTQSNTYNANTTTDNSAVIAAINKLADAIISNSSKEITLQMNGQTVGKVLTPIMTPMTVREINNTSVSI